MGLSVASMLSILFRMQTSILIVNFWTMLVTNLGLMCSHWHQMPSCFCGGHCSLACYWWQSTRQRSWAPQDLKIIWLWPFSCYSLLSSVIWAMQACLVLARASSPLSVLFCTSFATLQIEKAKQHCFRCELQFLSWV